MTVNRRTMMGMLGVSALPVSRAFGARYAPLPQPDPELWHVDTPPVSQGTAVGPNGAVYYRVYGKPGRVPVIVLHGGPAGGETYMRPYAGLALDRQVVLYDQSGCGRSARPGKLSLYTVDRYVAELEALRAHLGFHKIALVGHSWGCFLGTCYAAAHPDRVAGVVLAGGAVRVQDYTEAARQWLKELGPTAVTTVARAEASGKTNDPAYVRLTEAYYARHLCRLNPMPTFLAKAGAAIGQNPVYIHLNGPSEFQFTGALASLDLAPQLRRLHMPTLVTCGEYDEAPPFVGARITRIVTGSMLRSFSGLSHMSHIEDPARVVGATRAFLQKLA